jgi:hypothetical protein
MDQEEESALLLVEAVSIRSADLVNDIGGDDNVSGGDAVIAVNPRGESIVTPRVMKPLIIFIKTLIKE